MNQYISISKKYYYPTLVGAALLAASLFHFSLPVFSAGTEAGTTIRNTATGQYEDDQGNPYTIESNTVDVTVAKVAGITNQPSGFEDETSGPNNTTVLTGDTLSFEFTITNVGNDAANIFIPDPEDLTTRGLDPDSLVITADIDGDGTFAPITPDDNGDLIVPDVPINGQIIIKVTGDVTATAAGAPIEVLLGDTGSNTDPNDPAADTQNQPDNDDDATQEEQDKDVRSETADNPGVPGAPVDGQREASALWQTFLGSNPLAMVRIEKTNTVDETLAANNDADLSNNVIAYSLELDVLNTSPNPLFTPGQLEGRDFETRVANVADTSNLVLVSDAIPANTTLESAPGPVIENGRTWTPVYAIAEPAADDGTSFAAGQISWDTTAPAELSTVTRIGWVYDANTAGPIDPDTNIPGFTFNVITTGLDTDTGGTVVNIAQVFGSTVNGGDVFDESGDQDPSNFNGPDAGPPEEAASSTGIADTSSHGVDSDNDNNQNDTNPDSPGGEDNVTTIGVPGDILNGPDQLPTATGDVFGVGPDNNHDFQNKGVANFPDDAQHNQGNTFDPEVVEFENTLSNPGSTDLTNVLLQPINPEYDPDFPGDDVTNLSIPDGTVVTLTLGTQVATYTYQVSTAPGADPATDRLFVLTGGTPIIIPTLAADVPLDYTVDVDLPADTGLSTDDAINTGFPIPVIAFIDGDGDGTPDVDDPATDTVDESENANLTVNQVYTGFVKVIKQVRVLDSDGNVRAGMTFNAPDTDKQPLPGDTLEYRVIYRNISEPQAGTGTNGILNGLDVMIDENGTIDAIDGGGLDQSGNNWGLDTNLDGDMDTVNVQNSASDSNSGTITFFTGEGTTSSLDSMTSAGTTDPGDTVTGYRSTVDLLAPSGAEDPADFSAYNPANGDSVFIFQRKVDEFDGLAEEGLDN